ncbi:MAG TPA: prolyl oligopeptidase family serine peptidase [Mycobacteriales bacterium]|nr:prolyl oligopeptidase family serine peptidase [Mycobacteriales bacterium]
MLHRRTALLTATAVVVGVGAATATAAVQAAPHAAREVGVHPGLQGIPSGAPPAAYQAEPRLPVPHGWPFGEQFPRTSGTGRLAGGATFWSDFLYDDHGARGAIVDTPIATLAPSDGTYVYANPKARNNGADIFRAAVGLDRHASYWRVDWNTLVDPRVPIAEWALDTDTDTRTGAATWPAGAGVRSPGIDRALVVSANGARLVDAADGKTLARLHTTVDRNARTFLVRVPRSVLPVSGIWQVRLAAGVADDSDTAFAAVATQDGALPGQPAVYNVTFRSYLQEPPVYKPSGDQGELEGNGLARGVRYGNFWMEDHQADALTSGDVSAFALPVTWSRLAAGDTTPEPLPSGYTNRWYVSSLHLGQGVVHDSGSGSGDLRPNFLGRVQPYAVYVPTSYDPRTRTPLTWILHSLSVMHNQYGALDPSMIQQECEDRHSICATTLGYGPDGWYFDEAERDFWAVWHALATTYSLDPERTVISGYSMGGFASYKLGLEYPDLFAKAMPLAGPPGCGLRVLEGVGGGGGPGRCTEAGDTTPMVVNARWLPYVMADGVADELVPVTSVLQQIQTFDRLGYRYHFELYPAEDHLVYATQDGFSHAIAQLGTTTRVRNPGHVTYRWYPVLRDPKLGIGPTGAYWVRGLRGRVSTGSALASVDATSYELANPRVMQVNTQRNVDVPGDPTPALVTDNTWKVGADQPRRPVLTVRASNVAALGLDMRRARITSGRLVVTTDGPTRLTLLHLPPETLIRGSGHATRVAEQGQVTLTLGKGRTTISLR